MKCSICGHDMPDHTKKCPTCGSKTQVVRDTYAKINGTLETRQPISHYLFIGLILLSLIIGFSVGFFLRPEPNLETTKPQLPSSSTNGVIPTPSVPVGEHWNTGFIGCQFYIDCLPSNEMSDGEPLTFIYNDQKIETDVTVWNRQQEARSLNGGAYVFLSDDGGLYGVYEGKFHKISHDALDFRLSNDGNAVAYTCEREGADESWTASLYLYNFKSKTHTTVQKKGFRLTNFCISPDGEAVAFINFRSKPAMIMLYKDYVTEEYTSSQGNLIAIANNADYLYEIDLDGNRLMCHSPNGFDSYTVSNPSFFLSANHLQLMYRTEEGFFLCGIENTQFSSLPVDPVMPLNVLEMQSYTLPVYDFFDHVYRVYEMGSYDLCYIGRSGSWKIARDAEVLYYSEMTDVLIYWKKYGGSAPNEMKFYLLDRPTEESNWIYGSSGHPVFLTNDGKYLYFSHNNSLFQITTDSNRFFTGNVTTITDNLDTKTSSYEFAQVFGLDQNGFIYYKKDGDLYMYTEGQGESLVYEDILSMKNMPNGDLYLLDSELKVHKVSGGKVHRPIPMAVYSYGDIIK